MTVKRSNFEIEYSFPDENMQAAEAVDVLRHAIWKKSREGRQGRRARNPSMNYSNSRSRNPRECLQRACEDLGFVSLREAQAWLQDQPTIWPNKLNFDVGPTPENIEGLEFSMLHPSVRLDYPTRVQKFLVHLNKGSLADVRPIVFGIKDAGGTRSRLMMKIMSDPHPQDQDKIVLDGRLIMRKGRAIQCLDGRTHAIFPGHMARLHINPIQGLRHLEFLDVPLSEDT